MNKYILLSLIVLSSKVTASDFEIVAAREGAPRHISDGASILVWEKDRYVQKHKGANQFICLVSADKQGTFEPSCFNEAAQKSVLPVYQFQRRMLDQGMTIQKIHDEISLKAQSGEFPRPEPGAIVYMMSMRNKYYDHFRQKLVDVEPHVMIYFPKIADDSMGLNSQGGLPSFYSDFPHLSVVHIHTAKEQ